MARPRYPSDEERARPFVRIHLTTRNHPTYAHVFADPELRGMVWGLWMVARGAYAGETDDCVTLTASDVNWICGTSEIRYGAPRLRKVCEAMKYELWEGVGPLVVRHQLPAGEVPADHQLPAGGSPAGHQQATSGSPAARWWRVKVRNLQRKQWPHSAKSRSKKKREEEDKEEEEEIESEGAGTLPLPLPKAPPREARKPTDYRQIAQAMVPEVEEAFASYGKSFSCATPGRLDTMTRVLKNHPKESATILVELVHGAVASWGGIDAKGSDGFSARDALKFDTVFRPKHFETYIEAARQKPRDHESEEDRTARVMEEYNRERARRRQGIRGADPVPEERDPVTGQGPNSEGGAAPGAE